MRIGIVTRSLGMIVFLATVVACNKGGDVNNGPAGPAPVVVPQAIVSETLYIGASKAECAGAAHQLCLVSEDADGNPNKTLFAIQGLNYQWGHDYVVTASLDAAGNYVLEKVLSDEPAPATESFVLPIGGGIVTATSLDQCLFTLGNEVTFTTVSDALCQQLGAVAGQQQQGIVATFNFTGQADQPILLQQISQPSAADWQRIRVSDVDESVADTGAVCNESEFDVDRAGNYYVRSCDDGATLSHGRLTQGEMGELDRRARAYGDGALFTVQCGGARGHDYGHDVFLTGRGGDSYSVRRSDVSHDCFRGDEKSSRDLDDYVRNLKARYFEARPARTPSRNPGPHDPAQPHDPVPSHDPTRPRDPVKPLPARHPVNPHPWHRPDQHAWPRPVHRGGPRPAPAPAPQPGPQPGPQPQPGPDHGHGPSHGPGPH